MRTLARPCASELRDDASAAAAEKGRREHAERRRSSQRPRRDEASTFELTVRRASPSTSLLLLSPSSNDLRAERER